MDPFQEVYERHYAAVHRFALFLTGDPTRADDLVADVFVRAWQARSRIQQGTVRAYLMTIARNLYLDHCRAARVQMVALDDETADNRPTVEARIERASSLRDVRARLRHVAPGDRRALLLHVVREMSYAEVASVLGISIGAVKSRLTRAREALRPSHAERLRGGDER